MPRLWSLIRRVAAWADSIPVLRQDAIFYLLAAGFALGEFTIAVTADYREWGEVAMGPYLAAALASEVANRIGVRRRGRPESPPDRDNAFLRRTLIVGTAAFVVVLPLGQQIAWRADAPTCVTIPHAAQAQPEVPVIERAGDRVLADEDPYPSAPSTVGVSPSNDCRSVNSTSFFAYLPGMVAFGLLNGSSVATPFRDARIELAGFTLLVVILALWLVQAPRRRKWRAFQFLVVLPTGALPMVTGGDDLPVLALLLLGLVLLQRRRPVWAGLAMGLAGTLKWTAWPLIFLSLLSARDEEERPAVLRYGLTLAVVVFPVVGAGFLLGPHAFIENVIEFPLGLTKVHSPAASPLPGQVLVQLLPHLKKELTFALVAGASLIVLMMLWRRPPRDVAAAARFSGWALAFATVVAPATRFGYFIYPANMLVWAYLLGTAKAIAPRLAGTEAEADPVPKPGDPSGRDQLASSTS